MQIDTPILFLDGSSQPDVDLIGGKAWSIARMRALGLNVPPAFVITTRVCAYILKEGAAPDNLQVEVDAAVHWLEEQTGRQLGLGPSPLLLSVRSGAPISMPGMMDTVLNLGMNDESEAALAAQSGDPAFARDTHRRFLELYAGIVLKQPVALDVSADPAQWRETIAKSSGAAVPQGAADQLWGAIDAVFQSWNSRRARRYRDHHGIPHDLGTAVTVQAMVFGNMDERSGTGVLFSRNPLTGEAKPYGEFLCRAQGEDIVSGRHTPMPLDELAATMPALHEDLLSAAHKLEAEAGDVQDIEFTVERDTLYLLQTRAAKRAPAAALRIASDMVAEGRWSPTDALRRIMPEQVRSLLNPRLARGAADGVPVAAKGEAASPGVGCGIVVIDCDEAEARARNGEAVILARATTSPDDLHGMIAAQAIITERGGSTSHAAVVGRALGRPCVVGCGEGVLDKLVGQRVTVDGDKGTVYLGDLPVEQADPQSDPLLRAVADWATPHLPLRVTDTDGDADVIVDLDPHADGYAGPLGQVPPGAVIRGAIFARDDQAVRIAVERKAATIITSPILPALVAAARCALPGAERT